MPLIKCPDCGREISNAAPACVGCGRPAQPPAKEPFTITVGTPLSTERKRFYLIGGIVFVLFLYYYVFSGAWQDRPATNAGSPTTPVSLAPSPSSQPAASAGFQSTIANVTVGKKLYLKTDHALVGEIVNIDTKHRFPDGTVRDGVQIRFVEGSVDWVPRETVHLIYVTR